jgi:hypothetical protein
MPVVNTGIRRYVGSLQARQSVLPCSASISTPVDTTITVPVGQVYCSTGAIVIDSVAVGSGIVQINGAWRLT